MPTRNPNYDTFIRLIIMTCITVITLAVIVALWIIFSPYMPAFGIRTVVISEFNITTQAELVATIHVEGVIQNPNLGLFIHYQRLNLSLWFDNITITSTAVDLPLFSVRGLTDTSIRAQLTVVDRKLPHGLVGEIVAQRDYRGSVDFKTTLEARFRYKFGVLHSRVRHLTFECSPLRLALLSNNTKNLITPFDCNVV